VDNVKYDVKGDTLTITIDLKKDLGPSASGKTRLIGSTRGGVKLEGKDGISLNVSVYRKI